MNHEPTGQAMGSSQPLHSKLLTAAAREVLRPMGLVQIGRSRTWLDDHAWWYCAVEFQPSAWSRGTYLNVGCGWLWHVKDYISFDLGDRVVDVGYTEFQNEAQFTAAARKYADRAAAEVAKYRKLISNVSALSKHYLELRLDWLWQCYDAGIACALSGNVVEASELFDRCRQYGDKDVDWVIRAHDDVSQLKANLGDLAAFRQIITERVQHARELLKLEKLEKIDFDSSLRKDEQIAPSTPSLDVEKRTWPIVGKPLEEILRKLGIS